MQRKGPSRQPEQARAPASTSPHELCPRSSSTKVLRAARKTTSNRRELSALGRRPTGPTGKLKHPRCHWTRYGGCSRARAAFEAVPVPAVGAHPVSPPPQGGGHPLAAPAHTRATRQRGVKFVIVRTTRSAARYISRGKVSLSFWRPSPRAEAHPAEPWISWCCLASSQSRLSSSRSSRTER